MVTVSLLQPMDAVEHMGCCCNLSVVTMGHMLGGILPAAPLYRIISKRKDVT